MATKFGKECFCSNDDKFNYDRESIGVCSISCAGNEVRWRCLVGLVVKILYKKILYIMHVRIQAKKTKSSDKGTESGDMEGTANARFPLAS